MAIKPVPKALAIIAVVAGIGYALSSVNLSSILPKHPAPAVEATVVAPPTEVVPAPVQAAPVQVAPQPATAAPRPTTADKGLDALLDAGNRKK